MRALLFDPSPRRLAATWALARFDPGWAVGGGAALELRQVPEPASPGQAWVRLRVLSAGICGSDLKEALLQAASDNPLSGLVSFPHVPGHEVVARVEDPGSSGLTAGQVVALDPWLGCRARGIEPICPACARGFPPHCRAQLEGGPWGDGRGLHLGNVRGLPGGFSEVMFAHRSQCHALPESLEPRLAVLADPLAVGLHALERGGEPAPGPVLVLGAGTIGLALALAARRRHPEREVLVTHAWAHQAPLIRALGAEPIPASGGQAVAELAQRTGARLARPWRGGPFLLGAGAALVLDSIGNSQTMELALRGLAPRGRIVVVGVARPTRAENTLAYFKEAEVLGSNGYGQDGEGAVHLLDQALAILAERGQQLSAWCTHELPLSQYRAAFRIAARPQRSGAIKVSLRPGED